MEHLNLFQIRSRVAAYEHELSEGQLGQLIIADRELLTRAGEFLDVIQQIADLASWGTGSVEWG